MKTPILLALLCALPFPALAQKPRELGNLVIDGLPEIPKRIAERTAQYLAARGASLLDWEPGGRGILIATRFGDTTQVHQVTVPGGDRQQLTFYNEPVSDAQFAAPRGDRGFFFRTDTGGGEFYQYYWFDRATGARTLITDGKSRNQSLLAANAGTRFAYVSTARNGTDFDFYVMNADGKSPKLVKEVKGQWEPLDFSADDGKLLIRHYVSIAESHLEVLDLQTGASTPVNEKPGEKIAYGDGVFAEKGGGLFITSDEGLEFRRLVHLDPATGKKDVLTEAIPWDIDGLAISPDGAWLAYVANEGGASALYLSPAGKKLAPKRVELPKGVVGRLKFDRQSKRLGFTISTAQSTADVFSVEPKSRKLTRWTFSEVGGLDPAVFVAPELVTYPSFDGKAISAWYYRPRTPGKAPVIINIHGGPESQSTAAFSSTIQAWVNELGAAVIVPNVRGSSGYGKTFLQLDNGDKREDSVKDIDHLLTWIAGRPELDAARVAVYGGSYGGYMVLASLIHFGDRLKCGVDMVGISNFVSFLERTESYRRDLRRAEYGDERDPAMRKHLLSIAPMTHAAKIKKPLFVAQGKNDPRVPVGEAEQIVKTVREKGSPVWYLLAKDEGHGFQKKVNRDYFLNAVTLFFEEHLLK